MRFAATIAFSVCLCPAARAEFFAELVRVPISAAAVADEPALANAETWQLKVTADHQILSYELYVQLSGGTFYQSNFGVENRRPYSEYFPLFPAAEFDSYLTMIAIGVTNLPFSSDYNIPYDGPYHFTPTASHHWIYNETRQPPPVAYPFAQMTVVPTAPGMVHSWIGRFYERLPNGAIVDHVVTFPEDLDAPFDADINLDFTVDDEDVPIWNQNFGLSGDLSPEKGTYDLDDDGDVDEFDGLIMTLNTFYGSSLYPGRGDFNNNGRVDGDDWKLLYHWNLGHKWNRADIDQNRNVDGYDFLQWQRQMGNGFRATPTSNSAPVPEPATTTMASFALGISLYLARLIGGLKAAAHIAT
jgi:hypothetical protein